MEKHSFRLRKKVIIALIFLIMGFSLTYLSAIGNDIGVIVEPIIYDHADIIQKALNDAARTGEPLIFSNPDGHATYKVCRPIVIPDGVTIIGNGATIIIDDATPVNGKAFTRNITGQSAQSGYFPYNEFAVMSAGMTNGKTTTFKMDGLNFVLRTTATSTNIPTTLFGVRYVKDVVITNCSFSVYSSVQNTHNAFDAYSDWNNLTISGCTFNVLTDAPEGGVWIRNHGAAGQSGDALIENCVFNKRSGDEALAIWGSSSTKWVKNVTVTNCRFNMDYSQYNNHTHFIGASEYADNIVFSNNNMRVEKLNQCLFSLSSSKPNGSIYIKGNTVIVDDMLSGVNYLISSGPNTAAVYVEENSITVNSSSGLKKNGIYGATLVSGNKFYGNAFAYITCGVSDVYYNEVEQCDNGFEYVLNCVGNTLHSVSNLAIIPSTTSIANSNKVVIADNNITSNPNTECLIYTMPGKAYANIVINNNTITGGRIYTLLTGGSVQMSENVFHIRTLDNIYTNGKTTLMFNNEFYDSSTGKSLVTSYPPTQYEFCVSVPVGTFVGLYGRTEYDSAVAGSKNNGDLIGYVKNAAGNAVSSWTKIYSKGA